ncbi:Ezrin/radixin/moesin family protein [Reichenbachiella ulvae]|uniref:Ezrin/radixin/moesin family protein n=1 Tax=Reichenbachiella ulvae TaxID=2980104 RepID=A0ABT3CVW6_9BACT|nr:Ezrin/radixin/moesin family protein [Reichenbachiella ulvae]MCV9387846.1 Ezrin/radixin/moesin family protein [Reichenbachiella ulvae]
MKNILAAFAVLIALGVSFEASAQMSKKETKEWKKRIKALSPEQYKALLEENKSLKGQLSSLKKEVSGVDEKLAAKDDQIADYQDQVSALRKDLAEAKKNAKSDGGEQQVATRGIGVPAKGVLFKVQIGAFAKKDLSKFAQNNPAFEVDDDDDIMRYTVGAFQDYWEADTFKKYLREIGVSDAFIVAYKDGKRVPIKEVLEGVI